MWLGEHSLLPARNITGPPLLTGRRTQAGRQALIAAIAKLKEHDAFRLRDSFAFRSGFWTFASFRRGTAAV